MALKISQLLIAVGIWTVSVTVNGNEIEYFCTDEISKVLIDTGGNVIVKNGGLIKERVSFGSDLSTMLAGSGGAQMEYVCNRGVKSNLVYCSYDNGMAQEWWSFNLKSLTFMHTTISSVPEAFSGSVISGRCNRL